MHLSCVCAARLTMISGSCASSEEVAELPKPASMSRRFCSRMQVSWILFALLTGCACSGVIAKELNPEQWKKKNVPVVRKYLLALKASQVGSRLSGVRLSDGTFRLKGQSFVADISSQERGLHAYKFRTALDDENFEIHYLWVDKGFKPVDLKTFPWCSGEWLESAARAGISGEAYEGTQVLPGGDIIVTTCQLRAPAPPRQAKPKAVSR